jgi:hypothetical protein
LNDCGTDEDKPEESQYCAMPPTVSIKALPSGSDWLDVSSLSISSNSSFSLRWITTNVTSCVGSGSWSGTKTISATGVGTQFFSNITSSQTYNITCTGEGGTVSDSITINPTAGFVADIRANGIDGPVTVPNNSSVSLEWFAANASSCQFYKTTYCIGCNPDYSTNSGYETVNFNGVKPVTAVYNYAPGSKMGYSILCKNSSGQTVEDSVIVYASSQSSPVSATIRASLTRDDYDNFYSSTGQRINLSWSSSGASSCTASGAWSGAKTASGTETVSVPYSSSRIFTISCAGELGSGADSVTIATGKKPVYSTPSSDDNSDSGDNGDSGDDGDSDSGDSGSGSGDSGDSEEDEVCKATCNTTNGIVYAIGCDGETITKCVTSSNSYKPYCTLTHSTKYVYNSGIKKVDTIKTLTGSECRPTAEEVAEYEKNVEEAEKRQKDADEKAISACSKYLESYKDMAKAGGSKYWDVYYRTDSAYCGDSYYFSEACKKIGGVPTTYTSFSPGRLHCKGET